jgi:hypothetical protein
METLQERDVTLHWRDVTLHKRDVTNLPLPHRERDVT